jgi:hypothetical protein
MKEKIKIIVSKKSKNENSYRTPIKELDFIEGKPIKGQGFFIGSSSHESGGIFTSDIEMIEEIKDKGYILYTRFSIYKIEFLKE